MKFSLQVVRISLYLMMLVTQAVCADDIVHTVHKGESLWQLSRKYHVSVNTIIHANGLQNNTTIRIGQKLRIPNAGDKSNSIAGIRAKEGFYHIIRKGDTIWELSHQYNVSITEILRTNNIRSPEKLRIGTKVFIPVKKAVHIEGQPDDRFVDYVYSLVMKNKHAPLRNWQYILIHHSATDMGNAHSFDLYHRYKRHMINGLAYHFVITNGHKGPDGAIEVGSRWKKQIQGGHVRSDFYNNVGIGICLVGNFEKYPPTEKQFTSLVALVEVLQSLCGIPNNHVFGHRHIKEGHTLCPGRLFPLKRLNKILQNKRVILPQ